MDTASNILIIGGGVIGLAIAVELKLRGAAVTVLSQDYQQAAGQAAAGMLAPQAENLEPGPMLDLCLWSRMLYPGWTGKLEAITGKETGYWPCGILAPVYEQPIAQSLKVQAANHTSSEPCPVQWLDRAAVHQHQPGLGAEVVGGWWFPKDAQVDNRALMQTLLAAARELGVEFHEGITVETIQHQHGQVTGLETSLGVWQAEQYVLATGAWSSTLLPVPVRPKKGQMLSVLHISEANQSQFPLQQVLFGTDIYLVPRRDGRIIIGATSEEVGFKPHNTPAGMQTLLKQAIQLYPALQDYPIQESWWGFRPATPDENPLLGPSPFANLTLATGHYRNGILLAPVTAVLLADLILLQRSDPLLAHFHYSRFEQRIDPPA